MSTTESTKEKIIREAKRIEEDCIYSAKGHYYSGQFWSSLHLWIGVPTAVLAAIAGASALSQFDNHNILAGILAIIVSALTAVTTFLNPNEKANIHRNAGNAYNSLKNRTRILREINVDFADEKELWLELNKLSSERDELNGKSPLVLRRAFKKARKGIEEGEATYLVDRR